MSAEALSARYSIHMAVTLKSSLSTSLEYLISCQVLLFRGPGVGPWTGLSCGFLKKRVAASKNGNVRASGLRYCCFRICVYVSYTVCITQVYRLSADCSVYHKLIKHTCSTKSTSVVSAC